LIRRSFAFLTLTLCTFSAAVRGQTQENQLDTNQALFAVLAARAAAGLDSPDSANAHPARALALKAIEAAHPPSLEDLKKFFAAHKLANPGADLGQYVTFALSVGEPPEFQYRYQPSELSPEAAQVSGFERFLIQFWTEAKLDEVWKQCQPGFEQALSFYHSPITKAVLEANAYMRNPTSGYLGRRFQVFVDLMGPPGLTQSRSLKDDYFVVLTPSGTTEEAFRNMVSDQTRQVRHAYLHYVLDPLSVKYSVHLAAKASMQDISDTAPGLDESFKKDFLLLATESLIRAVEARLSPAARRDAMVDAALKEGYVLTPYFAEALPVYEKQEESMRIYYPDMIDAINLKKETKRLEGVQFAAAKPATPTEHAATPRPRISTAQKALMEAESLSAGKQYEKAKAAFNQVLQEPDEAGLHARAYFGLGRIAAFEKDPELAEKLFQKTLEGKPDAETESWADLYLGRLAAAAGENGEAAVHYKAALAVKGGALKAQTQAEAALTRPPDKPPEK
jgi:tetratricopeptide (TPR) repeat protein